MTTNVVTVSYDVKWCLTVLSRMSTLASMKPDAKEETTVLNLRDMPRGLVAKLKAAAALEQASLKDYLTALLQAHVTDLEKKGHLPKGK